MRVPRLLRLWMLVGLGILLLGGIAPAAGSILDYTPDGASFTLGEMLAGVAIFIAIMAVLGVLTYYTGINFFAIAFDLLLMCGGRGGGGISLGSGRGGGFSGGGGRFGGGGASGKW